MNFRPLAALDPGERDGTLGVRDHDIGRLKLYFLRIIA